MITKTAMITICGRPNVGKSTLTNALVGEKIAIVSNKPQTTRNRISAVVNRGDTQLILMDTPGFHKPRNRLGDYMVQVVRESVADVDGVMLVVEPIASIGEQEHALIERIRTSHAPAVLVINKIDTVEKPELLAVIAAYSEALPWRAIVPVSAQNGDGLEELFGELAQLAVPGPQLFPDDMISDMPEKQICAELVREKLLLCLDKEIPHGTSVEVTKFSERDNGIIDMDDQVILGNLAPKFTFGFNNSFTYKNFNMNIFLEGTYGNDIINYTRKSLESMDGARNNITTVLDRWTPENPNAKMPRADVVSNSTAFSDRWVEDGSYLRIRDLTLGYTIPRKWLRGIANINVFVSFENLYTFTKYTGYDPSIGGGIDQNLYPTSRKYSLGVSMTF